MTKQDHIDYWKNLSVKDLTTVDNMIASKDFVPALFFMHLSIEKLLKAFWVKNNQDNTPPFTHDLAKLSASTSLSWTQDQVDLLIEMNFWQIEARYPDYKLGIYRLATPQYVQHHVQLVKALHQWLVSNL